MFEDRVRGDGRAMADLMDTVGADAGIRESIEMRALVFY